MPAAEEQRAPIWQTALQSVALFLAVQFIMRQFAGTPSTTTEITLANGTKVAARIPAVTVIPAFSERARFEDLMPGDYKAAPHRIAPIWPVNASLDLKIYVSSSFASPSFARPAPAFLVLDEKDFRYGDWNDSRDVHTTFNVPKEVQNNGTLWAHFFVGLKGCVLDPRSSAYDTSKAFHFPRPLTTYLKKKKIAKVKNLLSTLKEEEQEEEAVDNGPTISNFYHPNFTVSVIPNSGDHDWTAMHPAVREWIHLESTGARDISGQNGWYYPTVFLNSFWQLKDHMIEINSTVDELTLYFHLNSLSNWKFSLISTMDFGMKDTAAKAARGETTAGGGDGSEFEMIKTILLDSNIYLLGTTIIVGILHTVFEMLAFKSDVSHWRNKKDNVGISVRTILANIFMQTVIFLYLMDNNENTSWMILMGQGMGILIEAWKITKTVDVRIRPTGPATVGLWEYLPYEITFEDKHKLSETEKKTQEYDGIAYRYMYMIGLPLIIAYGIYSLMYDSHKSWYSFVITTLVGSVYAYGFLLMLPSLYINYRLQSVAHMPGKALTYKVLSTFIDDLFAFTIKMPTLHRLATLRDDVVFFVYLYQSWKYKVDHKRVNEFGQGGEDDEGAETTVEAKKKLMGKSVAGLVEAKETVSKATGRAETSNVKRRKA